MKGKVDVYAYSVLVEPKRWIELSDKNAPWSIKYLFDKQLQEADFIVITKLDTLKEEHANELLRNVAGKYPDSKVLGISARDGVGVEAWLTLVQATPPGEHWLKEIDYEKYAEAEAEMGWLNGLVTMTFPKPSDGKIICARMIEMLAHGIADRNCRIGHLKLLAVGPTGSVKVGLTQFGDKPGLEGAFIGPLSHLEVTVNIRATLSPGALSTILHDAVTHCAEFDNAETDIAAINTFRPGAPNPTYRYGEPGR